MYDNFEYNGAIKYYNLADTLTVDSQKKLAFSYFNVKDFKSAETQFKKLLDINPEAAEFAYLEALCVKNNGDLTKAKTLFKKLITSDSTTSLYKLQLESIDSLISWNTLEKEAVVQNLNVINTSLAEFSPRFYNEGILISAELKYDTIKKRKTIDFYSAFELAKTKEEKEKLKASILEDLDYGENITPRTILLYIPIKENLITLNNEINIPENAIGKPIVVAENKNYNIGSFDIHPESNQLYYTRTPVINRWQANLEKHSLLYSATIDRSKHKLRKNKLVNIKKISRIYGLGEPSISSDGNTLYFVSDQPKGFGGTDIYKVIKNKKGKWGKPINLGETINTIGDELNPFLYDDNKLYFSSNARSGYGGYDIYCSLIIDDTLQHPLNLKAPINSNSDEFGICIHPINESYAMVTSNRNGAGDDDIYALHFTNLPPYVKGLIVNEDGSCQKDAIVRLVNASNEEITQIKTKNNGKYRFDLDTNQLYNLKASIVGFSAEKQIETNDEWKGNERQDLTLVPAITIQGYVSDENMKNIPSAKMELFNNDDSLLITIFSDTNGYYQFVAEKNITYLIIGSKEKKTGSLSISTNNNYLTDSISNLTIFNPNAFVEGVVYGKDSLPIKGAIVRLFDSSNVEIARILSAEDGSYHFDMTSNKNYRIIATIEGMTEDISLYTGKDWEGNEKRDLYLIDFPTAQGKTINKGQVHIADAKIELFNKDGDRLITIFSNDTGYYQLPLMSDSLNILQAKNGSLEGDISVIKDSNYNTHSKNDIILSGPQNNITSVKGLVLDGDGNFVTNANIKIHNLKGELIGTTKTDSTGMYSYELNKNENYEIIASIKDFEGLENIYTGEKWNPDSTTNITLFPIGYNSEGEVIDSKSQSPVEGVTVTLFNNDTEKKAITTTNIDGVFKIKLSPNTNYTLKLSMDGYFPKTIELPMGNEIPEKIILDKETLDLEPSSFVVEPIYFDYDKFNITTNSKKELDLLAKRLMKNENEAIEIISYTDCRGSNQYNITLSKNRSLAVKRYLTLKGVETRQIKTKSLGATNFVNNCYQPDLCSEKEHSLNRRAEFQFKPIK
jgi:outer membrane protein OmpA-like peptidoglycan-associated protein/tetratricopeptide (TPR) repeat protein